ncbi:anti-sigma factor [Nocardioides sp. S5]|uniref:anti-sigma factor family protein n=1 Tax=Nocardioides sp. S5 TaxID=2017486 RepID=UPI001A8F4C12|nr:zf-HC2 domain-containing protein [Nocardioides sp. S5]QSR29283.1 anti-sigma factor [Nocardioides sp. S5]
MSVSEEGHRELRELLGSYALGHLPDDQVARVRAHLDGCRACRADLDELLPLARRLDAVDADAFGDVPAPPPGLGDDIWQAVSRERTAAQEAEEVVRLRPRRTRLLAAAAAVVVALGVGGAVGRATAPEPAAVPTEAISMRVVQDDPVSIESADLVAHTWGVELRIVAAGFTEGETFRASFRTEDGTLVPAGEFLGVGSSRMTCFLQSAALREDVTQVLVTDETGTTVLSSDL